MRYIHDILLPDEPVLFDAKIHPILYVPGIFFTVIGVVIYLYFPGITTENSILLSIASWLQTQIPSWPQLYNGMYWIYRHFPDVPIDAEWVGIAFILFGLIMIGRAFITIYFTELVVTHGRIISKEGVYNTTTYEIDRRKIAGVMVHQTFWGRVFNYGWVLMQGFSGGISGLPVISNPHQMQRELNRPY